MVELEELARQLALVELEVAKELVSMGQLVQISEPLVVASNLRMKVRIRH